MFWSRALAILFCSFKVAVVNVLVSNSRMPSGSIWFWLSMRSCEVGSFRHFHCFHRRRSHGVGCCFSMHMYVFNYIGFCENLQSDSTQFAFYCYLAPFSFIYGLRLFHQQFVLW